MGQVEYRQCAIVGWFYKVKAAWVFTLAALFMLSFNAYADICAYSGVTNIRKSDFFEGSTSMALNGPVGLMNWGHTDFTGLPLYQGAHRGTETDSTGATIRTYEVCGPNDAISKLSGAASLLRTNRWSVTYNSVGTSAVAVLDGVAYNINYTALPTANTSMWKTNVNRGFSGPGSFAMAGTLYPSVTIFHNGQLYVANGEALSSANGTSTHALYGYAPTNRPPSVANRGFAINEDTRGVFTLSASDPDAGDYHSYSIVAWPHYAHGSAYISGNQLVFTPNANWNGTASLTYVARDSKGATSNVATVTITVYPVNDAPSVHNVAHTSNEDTAAVVALPVNDIDLHVEGDSHAWYIVTAPNPAHGSAAISGNHLFFYPNANWHGTTTLTYRARDSRGAESNVGTVTINVSSINDIPSVQNLTLATIEDTAGSITLPVTDADMSFEGDSHSWHLVTAPNAAHGNATISGNRLTFTPHSNWNGTTSLTYRALDSRGAYSNTATVTVTATPQNDTPSVSNVAHTSNEDTVAAITLPVSDVDLNYEGDSHSWSLVTAPNPAHGTASVSGNQLMFTPVPNWNGITTMTYRTQDSKGAQSNTATVTLTVRPVNDAPSISNAALATSEDTAGTLGLAAEDIDTAFEGDNHSWSIVSAPNAEHGAASIDGNRLTFTPAPDWNGSTTLTYQAQDSKGAMSNVASVSITVSPVNDIPSVPDLTHSMEEDTSESITLPVEDVDLRFEGDSHTWHIVAAPPADQATAAIEGNTLTFTPVKDWFGTSTFTYKAIDSHGAESAAGSITVTVHNVNDMPVVEPLVLATEEDTELRHTLIASDIDSEPTFVFELIGTVYVDEGAIRIEDGTLIFMPAERWNGDINLAYRAQDAQGAWSDQASVSIKVTAVNNAPAATGANFFPLEGQQTDPVAPWIVDADLEYGDTHTYEIVTQPVQGSATLQDGKLIYTPKPQYVGGDEFQIRATDSGGLSVVGNAVVGVKRFNYAPTNILPGTVSMYRGIGGTATLEVRDANLWDSHTLEVISQPEQGQISVDGMTITYRTASSDNAVVRVRATDEGGLTFEKDISLEMGSAWQMIEGRETVSLDYGLKLPAIASQLHDRSGKYALRVSDVEALSQLGDDMILVVSPSSEVGAMVEDRGLSPGEGMRFAPFVHTESAIESKAGALDAGVPGTAELFLSRADMSGPVYSIPVAMWTLAGELTSNGGWNVLQGVGQTRIALNTNEPVCTVSTDQKTASARNLLDDPYCFVRWETIPEESRVTSNTSTLQMDTIGRSVGVQAVKAVAFVYDNAGAEHVIGAFEQNLTIEPLGGLVSLHLMPAIEEAYQAIQDLSLVLRLNNDSLACDLTNSESQARRAASNWSLRPTCLVNWTSIPDGLKQADNWSTPQLRGGINGLGEQTIGWSVSVFTPAGHQIVAAEQNHVVNVIAPPAIGIELPSTPDRISDTMFAVSTDGGFVGSAVITAVPANIHVRTQRDIEVVRDEVVVNYGRTVRMTTPISGAEAPLWTVTPFTIEASYAQLSNTTSVTHIDLLAVPPDTVLPVILNEERVVLDTNEFIVSAQILDTRHVEDGYSVSKHGDWDLRLVKAMPGGVYEPLNDWTVVDEQGKAEFALDLTDLSNQVMRVFAEARVRSPVPEYISHRRSVAPLALSILNGSALDAELTTLRLIGLAPLRTSFFVNTVERWESRDIGGVRWEVSTDNGATWEEQPQSTNVPQRFSRIFQKGNYLVRAHVENRHSGAMSVTPSVEVIAFEVPKARLEGPQNVFIGGTGTYSLTNVDGTPFDPTGVQIEWSADRGQTWVKGGSSYSLSSDTAQRFYLQARLKFEEAPEHRLAYKNLRVGVGFRAVRPPRVQMIGPRRPEVGREATWKANMMMPYPNMGLTMDGFFILPDGTIAESREVQYTPTYADFEREESYLAFDAWINGYEEVGGRGVTRHRLIFWSYDWPEWAFQVKSTAIYSPADVTVTLRNLGLFREFENLQVEWEVVEGQGLLMTRDTSSLSRSFTITEPGTYLVAAHVSDGRGNYSYVEQELVFYSPPEWSVDLTWSGDNPFNRAPLEVLLRPQYSGGHPRDRIETKEYFLNGDLMESSGDYGRATLNAGTHEVTMRIATMMGYEAIGRTNIAVVENIAPVCDIEVTPGRTSWLAKSLCTDGDGRVATYRWWVNGEEQTITSSSISVPMWRYPEGEPIITVVGVDDSGGESEPVAQK